MENLSQDYGNYGKNSLPLFFAKPDVIEYIKRAKYIVAQPEVKKVLCVSLNDAAQENLLEIETKVRTVKALTLLLADERIALKFSIDTDAHLFAFMTREILTAGIENYCYQN